MAHTSTMLARMVVMSYVARAFITSSIESMTSSRVIIISVWSEPIKSATSRAYLRSIASLSIPTAKVLIDLSGMAYNKKRGLIDLFGGQEDLQNGIIRCVGNPAERYLEDALRIMRAMRFSAQLSFSIETNTYEAMNKYAYLLHNISEERIREEFVKTLTGIGSLQSLDRCRKVIDEIIPEAVPMFGLDQKNDYHCYDVWQHTLHAGVRTEQCGICR